MSESFLKRNTRFFVLCGLFLVAFLVATAMTSTGESEPSMAESLHGPTVLREVVKVDAPIETASTEAVTFRPPQDDKPAAAYEVIEVEAGGAIRGVVALSEAPSPTSVRITSDQQHCGGQTMSTERVVFDPATLGLKNAVVRIVRIEAGKAWTGEMAKDEDTRSILVDQKLCRYTPHISVLRTNTQIAFGNSDQAEHNVRGTRSGTTQFNLLTGAGVTLENEAEAYMERTGIVTINCNIHPWMSGYIHVCDHPYIAVTDAEGAFILDDVPPGTYTLLCWHEGMKEEPLMAAGEISGYYYGPDIELTQEVTVEAGKALDVRFTIPAPK